MSGLGQDGVRRQTSCFVHGLFRDKRLQEEQPLHLEAAEHMHYKVDKNPHPTQDAGTTSRLLTKKQLSDMAFSIRELSKRLGHFKLKLDICNVFVLTKAHDETLVASTKDVVSWLLSKESGGQYNVYVALG